MDFDRDLIIRELHFKTARSGGKGGQHVNKVSSKVWLGWEIASSRAVSEQQKSLLASRLQTRINKDGILYLEASEDRSQVRNKAIVVDRFLRLIQEHIQVPSSRKKTKTPKSAVLARLDRKKRIAQKKVQRSWRHRD
ncbi:MAG TPA: aminoacyl-tRNA hydrolase [Candidatus Sphingobacterium stercorigallinarum]|nr:aminoacyl-tRNA hydrolase [Candidatus Sphingobacterium stercorigallinarum]